MFQGHNFFPSYLDIQFVSARMLASSGSASVYYFSNNMLLYFSVRFSISYPAGTFLPVSPIIIITLNKTIESLFWTWQ